MKKRILSCFLALVLALSLLPMSVLAAGENTVDISTAETLNFTESCTLTGSTDRQITLDGTNAPITVTLSGVTVTAPKGSSGIKIEGQVTLRLAGESTVTGGDGSRTGCAAIEVEPEATLTVEGDGKLTALAGAGKQKVGGSQTYTKWARGGDAIGGNGQEGTNGPEESGTFSLKSGTLAAHGMAGGSGIGCKDITIEGGNLTASATREERMGEGDGQYSSQDSGGYGIGSRDTDTISITGGTIDAKGEAQGAGIGASNAVSISGNAQVTAVGGTQGAGVGNGYNNPASPNITISGEAKVTASSSGSYAPGVGVVRVKNNCTIEISGSANVKASGGQNFPGIGGNSEDDYTLKIQILGSASVDAAGGDGDGQGFGPGAGIGSGAASTEMAREKNQILIDTTGTVTATGGNDIYNDRPGAAAGIGGTAKSSGGTIHIKNGTIVATGGQSDWGGGAGIGGGSLGTSGTILIEGGTITATGGNYAAAIGSGYNANVDTITINNGELTVTAGQYGTGIGSGQRGAAGTIDINGGTIHAQGNYGNAIGSGHEGGVGTINFNGGTTYAVSSNHYGVDAIGGGRKGAACTVNIKPEATVYAFSSGLGNENYKAQPAIRDLSKDSAPVIQGNFHPDHPMKNMTLAVDGKKIQSPEFNYWAFAFTVGESGEYTLTTTKDGKTIAATTGNGELATTKLQTNQWYQNLYWSEIDEGGLPINPEEPDPIVPDEGWMDGYTGSATYDEATNTTTITGSITDGKFLYVIPEDVKGTVVLDGTSYIDALISKYVNTNKKFWYPGTTSGDLPIVVKNKSDFAYTYADADFGIDDNAAPAERYHIGSMLGRLDTERDKDVLRTACQPIQDLYNKSSDALTTKEVLHVMDKVEETYPDQNFKSFGDYALWYYQTKYEDAKDAKSLLDLPVKYQLNLLGYASVQFDPDMNQGNIGTNLPKDQADEFLKNLSTEDQANVIAIDNKDSDNNERTSLYVLESDPAILEMGRYVAYTYGIAFTFDQSKYPITSGDSANSEEHLKYLNEALGWNALCKADLSKDALTKAQGDGLTEAQKVIKETIGGLALHPDEVNTIERGQLAMPAYAIPNAMDSSAMLRGLTMKIKLTPSYSVIYEGNGGQTKDGKDSVVDGYRAKDEIFTVQENMFQRDGYRFVGWTQSTEFEGINTSVGAENKQPEGNVILQAKWKKIGGGGEVKPPVLDTENHYGYIVGYKDDTVRPNGDITRAEVATIFFRLLTDESRDQYWSQTNDFSDVAADKWYNNAISTLTNAGILDGYEDGTFRPDGKITRAEFATIAVRFFDLKYEGEDLFPDIANHWARDYINQAAAAGFVNGYEDDTFRPDNPITRAEAVTMVNRTLERKPHKHHMLDDEMITWSDNMDKTVWYYEAIQEATNSHEYYMEKNDQGVEYEVWTKILPMRDWPALEKEWSQSNGGK